MLRPSFAWLLLLCLGRTLLPEAWVLALHAHEHTTEEPAFKHLAKGKSLVSPHHTHCQTEQFYNVPFGMVPPVAVPPPRLVPAYRALAAPATLAGLGAVLRRTSLRGPPMGLGAAVAWGPRQ